MTKFKTTDSVLMMKSPGRKRSCRTEKQLVLAQDGVTVSPGKSICRCSQQLEISTTSLHRTLHKNLHMHEYKIQLTQNLKTADPGRRSRLTHWVLKGLAGDNNFAKQIIFIDEVYFHLSGFVKKQNCRIRGNENPTIKQEREIHPLRTTVWCGFWAG